MIRTGTGAHPTVGTDRVVMDATALATELARLHSAYERLVHENSMLKRQQGEAIGLMKENETLRQRLRAKATGAATATRPSVRPPDGGPQPIEASAEYRKLRDENRTLGRDLQMLRGALKQREVDVQRLKAELGRPQLSDDVDAELRNTVGLAVERCTKELKLLGGGGADGEAMPAAAAEGWNLEAWLDGLQIRELIASCLGAPIRRAMASLGAAEQTGMAEKAFLAVLGAAATAEGAAAGPRDIVASMLREADVVSQIARKVCDRAARLHSQLEVRRAALQERRLPRERTADEEEGDANDDADGAMPPEATADDGNDGTNEPLPASRSSAAKSSKGRLVLPGAELAQAAFGFEGASATVYGRLDEYYAGLGALLGSPETGALRIEAMAAEHTAAADSSTPFVGQYGVRTTSEVEWWFVADPLLESGEAAETMARARLQLGLPDRGWPRETVICRSEIDARTGHVPEGAWVPRRAEPRNARRFEAARLAVNLELRKAGGARAPAHGAHTFARAHSRASSFCARTHSRVILPHPHPRAHAASLAEGTITPAEFTAARLFTGPCGAKYNLALRALGCMRLAKLPTDERVAFLGAAEERSFTAPRGVYDELTRSFTTLNKGNKYVATIHTLSNALAKLGRIHKSSSPLYRALPPGGLPLPLTGEATVPRGSKGAAAATAPSAAPSAAPRSDHGVSPANVVDFGVVSATTSREVAMGHASASPLAAVIQIEESAADRGADLKWLSQARAGRARGARPGGAWAGAGARLVAHGP